MFSFLHCTTKGPIYLDMGLTFIRQICPTSACHSISKTVGGGVSDCPTNHNLGNLLCIVIFHAQVSILPQVT